MAGMYNAQGVVVCDCGNPASRLRVKGEQSKNRGRWYYKCHLVQYDWHAPKACGFYEFEDTLPPPPTGAPAQSGVPAQPAATSSQSGLKRPATDDHAEGPAAKRTSNGQVATPVAEASSSQIFLGNAPIAPRTPEPQVSVGLPLTPETPARFHHEVRSRSRSRTADEASQQTNTSTIGEDVRDLVDALKQEIKGLKKQIKLLEGRVVQLEANAL